MIDLNRSCISALRALLRDQNEFHAGWFQSYALDSWPDGNKGGEAKQAAVATLTRCKPSELYKSAFSRWKSLGADDTVEQVELALEGRLYIGVTRDNALEAGITVSHTYGMPVIPGSAVKGVTRAWAEALTSDEGGVLDTATFEWLFGVGGDQGESGGLVFHDAWWIPDERIHPFVKDIVTPHQPSYYGSEGGTAPSDFEDPIPAPQIAVQGRFLFTVEGPQPWVAVGRQLMVSALCHRGIGSKTTSGYGFFRE